MTFREWWEANSFMGPGVEGTCRAAWDTAVAEEREACQSAMCPHCRDGLPIHKTWGYGGEEYELWLHLSEDRTSAFPCQAAAIRSIKVT